METVILVVEDEFIIRDLVVEMLTEQGYRVLDAADGQTGLRLLQEAPRIDVLIADVRMPGLDGRRLAQAAQERWPDIKILLTTGFADASLSKGLTPGMEIVLKPFEVEALLERVDRLTEGALSV